jgi:ribosome-binding ATPase
MKAGIIGFARSGKTTVFNAISGAHAAVGAFGSRDANVATIKVPDARVDKLSEIFKPKKKTFAECQFLDIAPSEASGENKVLDNAALTLLKNVDALVHVVRAFQNEDVAHPANSVDPIRDCKNLDEELQLTDLIVIEKRIERLDKEHRKTADYESLLRCRAHIEAGKPLRTLELSAQETHELAGFGFLSQKPMMLLGN